MSEDPPLEVLVSVLDDEYARSILVATCTEPMSATELADHCDASLSTISRRLDRLETADLVHERTRPRADGHHDTIYTATLAEIRLRLEADGFEFDLRRRDEDAIDRLQRLWGDL
ncbi:ArsR/SmtB family transcription factor [Halovivax cerinus]|uniref:ArsR/SmtB family transcription factor n=1 Tax=Halovivax cerinus TaxID=1487865 RepID=A0ABD5NJH6_9EURY|nr:winged helix-turn-helix domain-containing protein [Halovivax cerinus]